METLPRLNDPFGELRRFRQVAVALSEEGLSYFVGVLKWHYLLPLRHQAARWLRLGPSDWMPDAEEVAGPTLPVRLRRVFERLGPSFVKLGQVLSMRPDVLPPAYIEEFAKLRDAVRPMALGVAEKSVERELGQPIENIFEDFESRPLAAASLAQVHRATLKDGTPVAVKVKRTTADRLMRTDLRLMAAVAGLLEERLPESRRFRPMKIAAEFADWTLRELDFELEGANMDRLRRCFAADPQIVIPTVYWPYVTKSVLVTDLLTGLKVDDAAALRKHGVAPDELARVGLSVMVCLTTSAAEKENGAPAFRLGLYDFGMVGSLSQAARAEVLSCFACFIEQDIEGFTRHMLDLSDNREDADIDGFTRETRNILHSVFFKPTDRKGAAFAFYQVLLAAGHRGICFPAELVLLGKAFLTVENLVLTLAPEIDLNAAIKPQVTASMLQAVSPGQVAKTVRTTAFDLMEFVRQLPEETRQIFHRFSRGEIGVRIDARELYDLKAEFDRQNDLRVLALMAVTLVVASAIIMRLDERIAMLGLPLGEIGFLFSTGLIVYLFHLIRQGPKP